MYSIVHVIKVHSKPSFSKVHFPASAGHQYSELGTQILGIGLESRPLKLGLGLDSRRAGLGLNKNVDSLQPCHFLVNIPNNYYLKTEAHLQLFNS